LRQLSQLPGGEECRKCIGYALLFCRAGFAGAGAAAGIFLLDGTSPSENVAAVDLTNASWISGPALVSILAELRVRSQFLQTIANVPDNLAQLRADMIADMGQATVLWPTGGAAPVELKATR
jgi:hypothetical protein